MYTPVARARGAAFTITVALFVTALLAPGFPRIAVAQDAKQWDELELRPSKGLDKLYVRPGASLAGYKRVRLERLQVEFAKDWKPNDSRVGSRRLTEADFDSIKNALANEFASTCKKVLAKGGYQVVDEGGEDVLDVTPLVVNLYITAPDKVTAGRSRTYTADPGQMTLVAELRDSETSQIIARVIDTQRSSWGGPFQMTTSVSNMAAAQAIITGWASALRKALDQANAASVR